MKKIKVLFVLSNLYPGGAQRTIVNIVNALNKEKYDINLVLLNKTKNEFYKNSIDADINYEYLSKKSRYSFIKLRKKILNFKPSIIFSTLNYVNIITFLTIKSTRVKSKIILRQSAIVRQKNYLVSKFYQYMYNSIDLNIALGNDSMGQLIKKFHVKSNGIQIVYNPINITKINNLKEHKVDDNFTQKTKIIVVGRLNLEKNHEMILKALKILKMDYEKEFEAIFLGDGPLKDSIEEEVDKFELKTNVRLLGNVENPYAYISNASMLVLSSYSEGFPNVILEAMACKTLVISTDCPYGPREIIKDKFGILVETNDYKGMAYKMLDVIENPLNYKSVVDDAYEHVQKFDSSNIAKQYDELFSELLL